jgi:16S rRNA (guanine527-N7)-methyltransferase
MNIQVLAPQLAEGLARLSLELSSDQQQHLLTYIALLYKWNAAFNLTAIRDPADMLVKHVFDALSVAPHLPVGGHWIDIGSGGGIPGLILAIANSSRRWTLLDSNGKKTRFLTQAVLELGLSSRVSVVHARAEDHHQRYQGIIARAVTEVADFIGFTGHLRADDGCWWMMKGQFPQSEIDTVQSGVRVESIALAVPYLTAERWLIRCTPAQAREDM